MLRTVVLHGALGREFGREFRLDVATPLEALRGLIVQLHGFRAAFRRYSYKIVVRDALSPRTLAGHECALSLGAATHVHFVPAVEGRGKGASVGKIIAGVTLIALAVVAPELAPLGEGVVTIFGFSQGAVALTGVALALSGAAALLAKTPETKQRDDSSFLLGGNSNVAAQGGCVPAGFGRFRYRPKLISAGLVSERLGGTVPEGGHGFLGGIGSRLLGGG